MQSFSVDDEEEEVFFESFDRSPIDSPSFCSLANEEQELGSRSVDSEFWKKDLMSVRERRKRFLLDMGFDEFVSSPLNSPLETSESNQSVENASVERIIDTSCAALATLTCDDDEGQKDTAVSIRDLDSGKQFIIQDVGLKEVGSNKLISLQEFDALLGLSRSVLKLMKKGATPSEETHHVGDSLAKLKKSKSFWKRFISRVSLVGMCKSYLSGKDTKLHRSIRAKVIRHHKKCLEFSALYMGQEIRAHKGIIRTMKFSPSGCYLASGGEDCVVRIWQVREVEASCKCSVANGLCEFVDKVKDRNFLMGKKHMDSAPVVIPKKVFMIDEKPLHELHGHTSDILDLSWSNSDCLLTSSMDKTVRLWEVGCSRCLQVFDHNDYVTSVQFNPVNNKYFISGSIDGKVRIWGVSENRVVAWTEIPDIVTAVCYRPGSTGFVVGSITGNCRFYDYSGKSMQLETQFCVQGRKKSASKPITCLQFSPEDSRKVLITSADSRVQIFDGVDVIHKFRGLQKTKSQLSASFTSDGRYIVSVGEDSSVYIWNYNLSGSHSSKRSKSLKSIRSCEIFSSDGVSVAVPWPGMDPIGVSSSSSSNILHLPSQPLKILEPSTWLWDSDLCSLGAWLFADGISKESATWPEEKLPESPKYHMHHRYQHLTHLSATWRQVIVTASRNGIIRTYHNYGLPVRL